MGLCLNPCKLLEKRGLFATSVNKSVGRLNTDHCLRNPDLLRLDQTFATRFADFRVILETDKLRGVYLSSTKPKTPKRMLAFFCRFQALCAHVSSHLCEETQNDLPSITA